MLHRREATLDWMSEHVYHVLPLSEELQQIQDLFPEQRILEQARPFYALDMGGGLNPLTQHWTFMKLPAIQVFRDVYSIHQRI